MESARLLQDERNLLRLTVLRRLFPLARDGWDCNSIRVRVEYAVDGVVDAYEVRLFTTDLEAFRDELAGDEVDDSGIILLKTIDGVVDVEAEYEGEVLVARCSLSEVPDGPEHARFTLSLTPAAVARAVRELDGVLILFPVMRGAGDPTAFHPRSSN